MTRSRYTRASAHRSKASQDVGAPLSKQLTDLQRAHDLVHAQRRGRIPVELVPLPETDALTVLVEAKAVQRVAVKLARTKASPVTLPPGSVHEAWQKLRQRSRKRESLFQPPPEGDGTC